MDLYRKVRLACAEGMSQREAARHFNISRDSVAKMMAFSVPPGYRRTAPVKRPKLDGFTEIIDGWLDGDREVHRKQRHTAKRVFERLRDEHGFTGGYTIVKDYMRQRERRGREMFVPLAHPPGHAQADFGEAVVVIDGVEQKAHFFVMDLPHSDACFVRAYPAATAEAWVDGHVHAFAFFGKVPVSVLYDNDRCLVAKILPDGTRQRATLFGGFLSHYLFRDRYGRPGKGNDKGNAEGLVGYSRRNFMVPIPQFASWDAFNADLEDQCRKRQADVLRGQSETIGQRLARDLAAMSELPAAPFDACDQATGRVSSQALVRYKTNDYSVPVAYGHRDVWIRGYVGEVVIGCGGEVIARHSRCHDREDMVFDPVHYLPLVERKINALDQAAPLAEWDLPPEFATLRRLMEARMIKAGRREYVQVLRLLETFDIDDLHAAVKRALQLGAVGFDAVKHLVLCHVEKRPPKLDLDVYPYLPRANVETTSAASYMALMGDGALGFWKALDEVFPGTRHQRCWFHKVANVLNKFPKSMAPTVSSDLRDIHHGETRAAALAAIDTFKEKYGTKFAPAVACLTKDLEALLAFFDYPAEHWEHLRTANPIESVFSTVRHRTVRTKGALSQKTVKLMVFTLAWTDRLRRSSVRISMDGKGRFLDNIFIERLWRTLKYECVYLHAWETGSEAKAAIRKWMTFYNHQRPHSALGGKPPALVYWQRNDINQPDQQVQRVA